MVSVRNGEYKLPVFTIMVDTVVFAFSPRFQRQALQIDLYHRVLKHLKNLFPTENLRSFIELENAPSGQSLNMVASFFDYVIVHQQRYHAATRAPNNAGRLVDVIIAPDGSTWGGELLNIIHIEQPSGQVFTIGHFRWFRPWVQDLSLTIWHSL